MRILRKSWTRHKLCDTIYVQISSGGIIMVNTKKASKTLDFFENKRTTSCFEDKGYKECSITKAGAGCMVRRPDFIILGKEDNKYERTKKKAAKLVKILSE